MIRGKVLSRFFPPHIMKSSFSQTENGSRETTSKFIANFDSNNILFEKEMNTCELNTATYETINEPPQFVIFDKKNNILDQKNFEISIQLTKGNGMLTENSTENNHEGKESDLDDSLFIADFEENRNILGQNNEAITKVVTKDPKPIETSDENKQYFNDVNDDRHPIDDPVEAAHIIPYHNDRNDSLENDIGSVTYELVKDENMIEKSNENEVFDITMKYQEENKIDELNDNSKILFENNFADTSEATKDEKATEEPDKNKEHTNDVVNVDGDTTKVSSIIADDDDKKKIFSQNNKTFFNEEKKDENSNKEILHIDNVGRTEDSMIDSKPLIADNDENNDENDFVINQIDGAKFNGVKKNEMSTGDTIMKDENGYADCHTKDDKIEASNVMIQIFDDKNKISITNDDASNEELKHENVTESPNVNKNSDQKNDEKDKNLLQDGNVGKSNNSSFENLVEKVSEASATGLELIKNETKESSQKAIHLSLEDILLLEGIFDHDDQGHNKRDDGEDILMILNEFNSKENNKACDDIFENIMSITNNMGDDEGNPFAFVEPNIANQNEKMIKCQSHEIATKDMKILLPLKSKPQDELVQNGTCVKEKIHFEKGEEVIKAKSETKADIADTDARETSCSTSKVVPNVENTQDQSASERIGDKTLENTKESGEEEIAKINYEITNENIDLLNDEIKPMDSENITDNMPLETSDEGSSKFKEKASDGNVMQIKCNYESMTDQILENGKKNTSDNFVKKIDEVTHENKDVGNDETDPTHKEQAANTMVTSQNDDLSPEKVSSFITALKQYRQSENKKNCAIKTFQGKIEKTSINVRKSKSEDRKKFYFPEHREGSLQDLRTKGNLSLGSGGSISFNFRKRLITGENEHNLKQNSDTKANTEDTKISLKNIESKEKNNSASRGNVLRKKKIFEQSTIVQHEKDDKIESTLPNRRDLFIATKENALKQRVTTSKKKSGNEMGNSESKGPVDKKSSINDWFVASFNTSIGDTTSLSDSLKSSFSFTKKSPNISNQERTSNDDKNSECGSSFSSRESYRGYNQSTKKYSPSYDFTPILPWQHQESDDTYKGSWKGFNRISARNIFIEGKETRTKRLQFIHEAEDNIEIEEISCSTCNTINSVTSPKKQSFEKNDSKTKMKKENKADFRKKSSKMNSLTKKMSVQTSTIIEETATQNEISKNKTKNGKFYGVNNIVKKIEGLKANNKNMEEECDLNQLDERNVEESKYTVSQPSSLMKIWRKEESLPKSRSSHESRKDAISSDELTGFFQSTALKQGKITNSVLRQSTSTDEKNNQNAMIKIRSMIALWEKDEVNEDKNNISTVPEKSNMQLEQSHQQNMARHLSHKEMNSADDEAKSKQINFQILSKRFDKGSQRRQQDSNNDTESKDVHKTHRFENEAEKPEGNNIYQIQKMRLSPTRQRDHIDNSCEIGQTQPRPNEEILTTSSTKSLNSNSVAPHFPFPRTGALYVSNKGDKIKPPRHPYFSLKNTAKGSSSSTSTSTSFVSHGSNSASHYHVGNGVDDENVNKAEQKGKLYTEEEVAAAIERAVKLATKQAMLNAALFHGQASDTEAQSNEPRTNSVSSTPIPSTSSCASDNESTGNARKLRGKSREKANDLTQETKVSALRSVFEKNETSLRAKNGYEHTSLKEPKSLFRSQIEHSKIDLDNSLLCSSDDDEMSTENTPNKSSIWKGFDIAKNLLR